MVSPLRGHGSPHRGAADRDGRCSGGGQAKKDRTYPELTDTEEQGQNWCSPWKLEASGP